MTNPNILYNNKLIESYATLTVSSEETGFEKENAIDGLTHDYWKPSADGDAEYESNFNMDVTCDAVGIAAHQFGDQGTQYTLESKQKDAVSWIAQTGLIEPVDNSPLLNTITAHSAKEFRLKCFAAHSLNNYSNEIDNAYWGETNTSITVNDAVAPDDTVTADKVSSTWTSSAQTRAANRNAVSSSQYFGISTLIKQGVGTYVQLVILNGSDTVRQTFNLSTGTIDDYSEAGTPLIHRVTAGISADENGFYKIFLIVCNPGALSLDVRGIQLLAEDKSILGDTSGMYHWLGGVKTFDVPKVTTGIELVTNGTLDADTDWTKGDGWSIASGVASSDGSQTASSNLNQSWSTSVGEVYLVTYEITARTAGSVGTHIGGGTTNPAKNNSVGVHSDVVIITSASTVVGVQASSTFVGSVDNISVLKLDTSITPGKHVITTAAAVTNNIGKLGVLMLGEKMTMPTGLRLGHKPDALAKHYEPEINVSPNAVFLGSSRYKKPIKNKMTFTLNAPSWVRSTWEPFIRHAEQAKGFLYQPQPTSNPTEVSYCMAQKNIPIPDYSNSNFMKVEMPYIAIAS